MPCGAEGGGGVDGMVRLFIEQQPREMGEAFWYNVLPVGGFHDPRYGKVEITPDLCRRMAENHAKGVLSYKPPVKLGHGDGAPSPGVVEALEARDDGLYARCTVDEATAGDIRGNRYRYMSAEFHPDYLNKSDGVKVGPCFTGVALVNQPAHPGVRPIALSDGHWVQETGEEERKRMDMEKRIQELERLMGDMQKENTALKGEASDAKKLADQYQAQLAAAARDRREVEVKAFCDGWGEKGIPPVVMDRLKPVLLGGNQGEAVCLSDNTGRSVDLMTLLGEVFEALPKVPMGPSGASGSGLTSGVPKGREAEIQLGDALAEFVGGEKR